MISILYALLEGVCVGFLVYQWQNSTAAGCAAGLFTMVMLLESYSIKQSMK